MMLTFLLPGIYGAFRIHLLGNLPNDSGLNIASQIAWVNVLYEVVHESLILPLFFLLGKSLKDAAEFENKVKTLLITAFLFYFAASVLLILSAEHLLVFMSQNDAVIEESAVYIRLESAAILLSVLYKCANIILIALEKIKALLTILVLQVLLSVVSDIFLVSALPISLNLGVNGIAAGNIAVNFFLFLAGAYFLKQNGINPFKKEKLSFTWQKEWLKVGWKSGLESLARNSAFIVMILKMVNLVQEQGNFWISLNFIWGWLLIPVLALGELIKRNVGANLNHGYIGKNIKLYYIITSFFVVLWITAIPFYRYFLDNVMNVQDTESVFLIVAYSLVFYILFAYNNILDSIFYGAGRTDLMLYQSLIVNAVIFGTAYILFKTGVFQPTLYKIVFLFGGAIAFDTVITFIIFYFLYAKKKLIL